MVAAEVLVPPDPEQTLIDFLTTELHARAGYASIAVGTAVPDPRPPRFVRVLSAGGAAGSLVVARPTLAVEGWSNDEADAAAIAWLCRGLILAGARAGHLGPVTVYDDVVEYSLPSNLPDNRTGQSRYTFTHEIPMRSETA